MDYLMSERFEPYSTEGTEHEITQILSLEMLVLRNCKPVWYWLVSANFSVRKDRATTLKCAMTGSSYCFQQVNIFIWVVHGNVLFSPLLGKIGQNSLCLLVQNVCQRTDD